MGQVQAHISVNGRVQGVGFRWFVRREASSLGLIGTVKNLSNGDVEIFVEGEKETISELVSIVRKGNRLSLVHGCEVDWSPAENRFDSFRILTDGW